MNKSDLKHHVSQGTDSHFFERSSMRFFGDTMANYYVPVATVTITTSSGAVHECYELQRRQPVKHGLSKSAYFDIKTFSRILPAND